jgi:hypothetical protein
METVKPLRGQKLLIWTARFAVLAKKSVLSLGNRLFGFRSFKGFPLGARGAAVRTCDARIPCHRTGPA